MTGGLSDASPEQLGNPRSITRVRTGQDLRIVGQSLFFAAIIAAYALLAWIMRKAQRLGKNKEALWWLAATAPFLILRGAYGIVSASDWQYSYYLPTNVSTVTISEQLMLMGIVRRERPEPERAGGRVHHEYHHRGHHYALSPPSDVVGDDAETPVCAIRQARKAKQQRGRRCRY